MNNRFDPLKNERLVRANRRAVESQIKNADKTTKVWGTCNCENITHFDDKETLAVRTGHPYLATQPLHSKIARFIGEVCEDCAENCVKEYLTNIDMRPEYQ